ncbi:MAG: hypothetical protein IKO07_11175 [Clostridia bacterium]|nr:hypothetical protein [Clostridia bacterium]
MKTDVIVVSSEGSRMDAALAQTEKVAEYKGLSHKNMLHLRLLAEEMMSMMGSIAGNVEGEFWIEDDDNVYQLHLKVKTDMDAEQRKQLISASSSGKNEAHRGFMGKLRSFFEADDVFPMYYEAGMMSTSSDVFVDMSWSMRAYREQVERYMQEQRKGADEAWDELEKSVVAHVADDVKVSIKGRTVDLTIIKKLA